MRPLLSYRSIVDELASLRNPRTLTLGIVNGYILTACFGALAASPCRSALSRSWSQHRRSTRRGSCAS